MNRKQKSPCRYRVKFITSIALIIYYSTGLHAQTSSNIERPNILIIHTDQQRIEALGAYGNIDIKTPNIDKLATDGVLFHNSYCTLPVCTPSRYSLLSGMYVHQHRGWTNHATLSPEISTLPDILKEQGYNTKAVGKMHFAPTYLDVGFSNMELAEQAGPGRWDDDYHRDLMKHGLADELDLEDQVKEYRKDAPKEYWDSYGTKATNLPDKFSSTSWIADRAVETIEQWGESGNMLMIGFVKPHHPFDPPKRWLKDYNPEELTILPGWIETPIGYDTIAHKGFFRNAGLTEKALRKSMSYYYASITQIDSEVGRIIALLKKKKLYNNTIIVYTSDHGEHLGYHHQILKGGYLYESIMKVPLIIKFPNNNLAGSRRNELVSSIDIAPTILKSLNLPVPTEMSQHSLAESEEREYIFAHSWLGSIAMARSKSYKLILNSKGKSLFFNLEDDPYEMVNLFDDPNYQEEVSKHKIAIIEWQGTESLKGENFLDYDAPIIDAPNAQKGHDGHRENIIEYYRRAMQNRGK